MFKILLALANPLRVAYAVHCLWVDDRAWMMRERVSLKVVWRAFTFKLYKEQAITKRLREWQ